MVGSGCWTRRWSPIRRGRRRRHPGRRQDRLSRRCNRGMSQPHLSRPLQPDGTIDNRSAKRRRPHRIPRQRLQRRGRRGHPVRRQDRRGRLRAVRQRHGFAAARYLPSGKLDTSFSGDGIGDDRVRRRRLPSAASVAIQPGTGKIVLGGIANGGSAASDMAVVRLNSNGTLDTTFNGTGRREIDFAGGADAAAGVLVGSRRPNRDRRQHRRQGGLPRGLRTGAPHAIGALDRAFDADGKRTLDIEGYDDEIDALAFGPGGTIVAAGSAVVNHPLSSVANLEYGRRPGPLYRVRRWTRASAAETARSRRTSLNPQATPCGGGRVEQRHRVGRRPNRDRRQHL